MSTENYTILKNQIWDLHSQVKNSVDLLRELSELTPVDCWNHNLLSVVYSKNNESLLRLTCFLGDLDSFFLTSSK